MIRSDLRDVVGWASVQEGLHQGRAAAADVGAAAVWR